MIFVHSPFIRKTHVFVPGCELVVLTHFLGDALVRGIFTRVSHKLILC